MTLILRWSSTAGWAVLRKNEGRLGGLKKSWEKVAFQNNLINRLNIFVKTFGAIIARSDKPSVFLFVLLFCDTGQYKVSHQ